MYTERAIPNVSCPYLIVLQEIDPIERTWRRTEEVRNIYKDSGYTTIHTKTDIMLERSNLVPYQLFNIYI